MNPCENCKGQLPVENVGLMRKGLRTTCPYLYVLPRKAETIHNSFVGNLRAKQWDFILVNGYNGDGKSVYIHYLEHIADGMNYPIVHVEIKEDDIAQYGPAPYFTLQVFNNLRLPDGEMFFWKLQKDAGTRKRIRSILEKDLATYEFWSPALTSALLHLTDDSDTPQKKMAISWLKGEPKYVSELKEMGIYDKTMKSILNVRTDRVIYLLKDLLNNLDYPGLIVSVDEIEKIADLNRPKSVPTLSVLRDIINILTSSDSMPTKRGITQGLFVVYGISTFFLGYSGVIQRSGVDFAAQADKIGRPKVTLMDVPRLGTVLKDSASQIDIAFDSIVDLENLAGKVIPCYKQATKKMVQISPNDLARASFDKTNPNTFLARDNVKAMMKILDAE